MLWYYGEDMHLDFSVISWNFFKNFFTEERFYQGLKDATLFGLLSDKSAEILGWKYSNFCQMAKSGIFAFVGMV